MYISYLKKAFMNNDPAQQIKPKMWIGDFLNAIHIAALEFYANILYVRYLIEDCATKWPKNEKKSGPKTVQHRSDVQQHVFSCLS